MSDKSIDAPPMADTSFGELVRRLSIDSATLVRAEIALARAEIVTHAEALRKASGELGLAGLLGIGSFFAATLALIELVHLVAPMWLAALVVAVLYAVAAGVSASRARTVLTAASKVPKTSFESVRDDVTVVRTGIARGH